MARGRHHKGGRRGVSRAFQRKTPPQGFFAKTQLQYERELKEELEVLDAEDAARDRDDRYHDVLVRAAFVLVPVVAAAILGAYLAGVLP